MLDSVGGKNPAVNANKRDNVNITETTICTAGGSCRRGNPELYGRRETSPDFIHLFAAHLLFVLVFLTSVYPSDLVDVR